MERTKYKRLTLDNRKTIANCIELGKSITEIAQILRVHKSTVSREIRRLGEPQNYRPLKAHKHAIEKREFSKKEDKLNRRPRKGLGYLTPRQVLGLT